jgi:tetratricopeptide (TPR) repeat protein
MIILPWKMTSRPLIISLFLLMALLCHAQDKREVDSLYNLASVGNDTTRIKALNELSRIFIEMDSQKALGLGYRSLNLAKLTGSDRFIAYGLNRVGSVYDYKSMPDSANLCYLQALKIFEKINDKSGLAAVYQNLGVLYYFQEDFQKALANYNKALVLRRETREDKYISKLYNNMGAAFRRIKKFDSAIFYYEKALELKLKQKDLQAIAATYQNIAVVYQYKKDFKTALDYLNKAIALNSSTKSFYDLCTNNIAMADLYESMGDFKKAREYVKTGIEYGLKADNADLLFNAYELLWILDTLNNDYKAAVRDINETKKYRNKIFTREKTNAVNKMQIVYETEKKDLEISALNEENEIKSREEIMLVVVLASITLLLITLLVFYAKKRKDNALLSRQKKEIMDKTSLLQQQASEIAKHRSQMNPHFVFNALHSLQGLILSNDSGKSIAQLNALSKLMRQTLNNSEQEWISLNEEINYLNNYVNFELQRFDLKFSFEVNVDPELDKDNTGIPPMLIQPLIENCMKHAGLNTIPNAKVILTIQKSGQLLNISVEDNGSGRRNSEVSAGSRALSILEKRIEELNRKQGIDRFSNLKIVDLKDQNSRGRGTSCEFEIPYFELY